jgi:hypothetical protein
MKPKVIIGTLDGGTMPSQFMDYLWKLCKYEREEPSELYEFLEPIHVVGLYVQENRNELIRLAKKQGADWLLQLDCDLTFRPDLLRSLFRTADPATRPILCGIYSNVGNVTHDGTFTVVDMIYAEAENGMYIPCAAPWNMQPVQVDAAGAGILLTYLPIFDKIPEPWFFIATYVNPETKEERLMNEDISFCRNVRMNGFPIWCDPAVEATHWKTLPLTSSQMRDFLNKVKQGKDSMGGPRYDEDIPGFTQPQELEWLYEQARRMDNVVELGCWMGRSTYPLLKACKGSVYAVDHFLGSPSERDDNHAEAKTKDIHSILLDNVGKFPNLIVIKKDTVEAAGDFEEHSIDMVFIDADHEYSAVCNDIAAWKSKCKKFFCGHDRDMESVSRALKDLNLEYKNGPGSLWYVEM